MHLKKLFAGINRVDFDQTKIITMNSSAGEKVHLATSVSVNDDVEI